MYKILKSHIIQQSYQSGSWQKIKHSGSPRDFSKGTIFRNRIKGHGGHWKAISIPGPEGARGEDILREPVRARAWRRNGILCPEASLRAGRLPEPPPSFYLLTLQCLPLAEFKQNQGREQQDQPLGLRVGQRRVKGGWVGIGL